MVIISPMTSLAYRKNVELPPPSPDDRRADSQRLQDALGEGPLLIPLPVLRRLPGIIRKASSFPCIIASTGEGKRVVDIGADRSYAIALDLGTTNLVALLYDNVTGKDVLTRSLENPQTAFGSDILTRMHHAMSLRTRDDVYGTLIRGVNDLIGNICRDAGIGCTEVHALAVAGNTVMTHFLLGLDISRIPVDPFVPVVRSPGFFTAAELGLSISPEAAVYVFPNAGSYVGGDITAGILAAGMAGSDGVSILIDVGTNAEVVIGNREWMIVGAGAAGPALEEGISRVGKRATTGIVYDFAIQGGTITCRTFDEGRPEGICGSGMVSLLFELFQAGMIDQLGAILPGRYLTEQDGETALALACGPHDALVITQSEIQNFMRSKAAMFTLLLVLTRSVGIGFGDIERVFVSGALGTGIDPRKASGIGMLPDWSASLLTPLGNSSLAGARMVLADAGLLSAVHDIAGRITYKHMHDDPEFMKEFQGAVFIPHTEPGLLRAEKKIHEG